MKTAMVYRLYTFDEFPEKMTKRHIPVEFHLFYQIYNCKLLIFI